MGSYRNLSLAKKLFLSLAIIAAIGMVIGFFGIYATSQLSSEAKLMYQYNTLAMKDLAAMYDHLASQRICLNNHVIFRNANTKFSLEEKAGIAEKEQLFDEAFAAYYTVLANDEEEQLYDKIDSLYYNEFKDIKAKVLNAVASGDATAMYDALYEMDSMGAEISDYMDQAFVLNDKLASDTAAATETVHKSGTVRLILIMLVGLACSIGFSQFLAKIISTPIQSMSRFFVNFGTTGDLTLQEEDQKVVVGNSDREDEIGQCMQGAVMLVERIVGINEMLSKVSDGDLTVEAKVLSPKDSMGLAIQKMVQNLSMMFESIQTSSEQISGGAKQLADGSQVLAQGATEQASSIERLSASIGDIAEKTVYNAGVARQAADLSGSIRGSAEKGNLQMEQMMRAVKEITEASTEVNKVVHVIEDIAFQTNILALNAAVEAAHAGHLGKGFAVVAEEVRSLAAKSAEAARDTGILIENTIDKSNFGLNMALETAASLNAIVAGINHSAEIVSEIANSSDNQAASIAEINSNIDQVSQVVAQNSATAQESAAASQQMSSQSDVLEQLVAQFKLKKSADSPIFGLNGTQALAMPSYDAAPTSISGGKYGKY